MSNRRTPGALAFAAAAAALLALAAAPSFAAAGRTVIYGAGYKPRSFDADNNTILAGVHWSHWTSARAVGTGTVKICVEGVGRCRSERRTITYTRPVQMCGTRTYTRFKVERSSDAGYLARTADVCLWYIK